MNKAFIFDWSGTLNDNFRCFAAVCALMFEKYGLGPIADEEIRRNFDIPYMKFWNKYIPDQKQDEHHELYEKFIHQVGEPEVHPGVKELIEYLYGLGYKLFILSSDPESKLLPEVEKTGLASRFIRVIGELHDKTETLAGLISEFELDKDKSFYVGDTAGDVLVGKAVGLQTIGISWGFQQRDILASSKPDFLIDDILEIKKIIS